MPHSQRALVSWTTVLIIVSLTLHVVGHECTLQSLKDVARNACDQLYDKLSNDTRGPFHRGRETLGFHLSSHGRHRRHTLLSHEYHKLNTRLRHGISGFMELSYSTSLYELVHHRLDARGSVSDWTENFLESKGFNAMPSSLQRTKYEVDGIDNNLIDIVSYRKRRSSPKTEESLEGLRNRRANHAKISYCCMNTDSAKCSDWLCYI